VVEQAKEEHKKYEQAMYKSNSLSISVQDEKKRASELQLQLTNAYREVRMMKKKTKESQAELSELNSRNQNQRLVIDRLKKVEELAETQLEKTSREKKKMNQEKEMDQETIKSLNTKIQQLQ
jgi:hypothetical protein